MRSGCSGLGCVYTALPRPGSLLPFQPPASPCRLCSRLLATAPFCAAANPFLQLRIESRPSRRSGSAPSPSFLPARPLSEPQRKVDERLGRGWEGRVSPHGHRGALHQVRGAFQVAHSPRAPTNLSTPLSRKEEPRDHHGRLNGTQDCGPNSSWTGLGEQVVSRSAFLRQCVCFRGAEPGCLQVDYSSPLRCLEHGGGMQTPSGWLDAGE